jgi:hypothetical protein
MIVKRRRPHHDAFFTRLLMNIASHHAARATRSKSLDSEPSYAKLCALDAGLDVRTFEDEASALEWLASIKD